MHVRFMRMLLTACLMLLVLPEAVPAQRRGRVVVRRPARTKIVVHKSHPIRRPLPATVVVRPARRVVTVGAPLRFLPPLVFTTAVVALPPRDRLVWQDTETISSEEEWVDCNFGVDDRGDALYLGVDGRTQLNFAEVTFENGDVQVVDFEDKSVAPGVHRLLDFRDGRHVKTVRLLARAQSDEAVLRVYLSR